MISSQEMGRQKDRELVDMLRRQPMTIAEIAKIVGLTVSAVTYRVTRLRDTKPKRVYIKEFRSNCGIYAGRPAPVYAAGFLPDVEFVPLRRPTPKTSGAQRCEQILSILAGGPKSSMQISKRMHVCRDAALRYLTQMRREGRVYISRWIHPNELCKGRGGSYTPVYAVGNKKDKPKPAKESSADRNARKRKDPAYVEAERQREAKRRAMLKIRKTPQGIFAALGLN